jgi:hypothetical protein
MGMRPRVHLQFGIDYGPHPTAIVVGAREASDGEDMGCRLESPDDSDHLTLYVVETQVALTHVGDFVRAVTPVPTAPQDAARLALAAFCERYGCSWREPQWFVTTEIG